MGDLRRPRKWLARYGDKTCGPMSLTKAKTAAMAMAKGAAGDDCLANPIPHLNGLTARLIDLDADPFWTRGMGMTTDKVGDVEPSRKNFDIRKTSEEQKNRSSSATKDPTSEQAAHICYEPQLSRKREHHQQLILVVAIEWAAPPHWGHPHFSTASNQLQVGSRFCCLNRHSPHSPLHHSLGRH